MKSETHVVEIKDLYGLIPECRSLEHKNFTNIKELLTTLIATIESAKNWEFVQYISNKPSLFVVRQRQGDTNNYTTTPSSRPQSSKPSFLVEPNEPVEEAEKYDNSASYDETETAYQDELAPTPKTDKLPWE